MPGTIDDFLVRLRQAVAGKRVTLARRPKNRQAMVTFRLTMDDVLHTLVNLAPEHFYRGPSSDVGGYPGQVMEFIAPVVSVKFYIKVRLYQQAGDDCAVTISFHQEGMYD